MKREDAQQEHSTSGYACLCVCVSSSMLMHANEKQLRGLMRLCSARPVQGREPGRPLSLTDTHTHNHTAGKKREEMWKSHGEI